MLHLLEVEGLAPLGAQSQVLLLQLVDSVLVVLELPVSILLVRHLLIIIIYSQAAPIEPLEEVRCLPREPIVAVWVDLLCFVFR